MNKALVGLFVAVVAAGAAGGYYLWQSNQEPSPAVGSAPAVKPEAPTAPVFPPGPLEIRQDGYPALCVWPTPEPVIPQGETASAADMRQGRDAVQAYVNRLQNYQACLEQAYSIAPPETMDEIKSGWRKEGNHAIDVANAMAAAFSVQLKAYKARLPEAAASP